MYLIEFSFSFKVIFAVSSFGQDHFGAIVAVNSIAFLVMTTLFINATTG